MLNYKMFLSFNNAAEVNEIPVLPERIEISRGGKGKTYDIVGPRGSVNLTPSELELGGEINVIKSPKLLEVSFSSIFPAQKYPFVTAPLLRPMKYVEDITRWMKSKHPIRFVFCGYDASVSLDQDTTKLDLNIAASIEQFDWRESAGSPGDIEYTIRLKEYRFYSAQKITAAADKDGNQVMYKQPPPRPDTRVRPQTYTVQQGDNLWKIGMKIFGRDGRWREIQKLNNLTNADVKKLQVGKVLKIPQD